MQDKLLAALSPYREAMRQQLLFIPVFVAKQHKYIRSSFSLSAIFTDSPHSYYSSFVCFEQ